jgi:hypothetical protein
MFTRKAQQVMKRAGKTKCIVCGARTKRNQYPPRCWRHRHIQQYGTLKGS